MFEGIFLIFCFLLIGYAMKAAKKDYSDVLVSLCVTVLFPAMILEKLYPLDIKLSDLSIVLMADLSIVIGFLAGFLLSKALRLERQSAAVVIMACGLGNTSFVGFPFVEAFYSKEALAYAMIFDQFGSFLFLSIFGSIIAAWGAGKSSSPKKLVKALFLFPPFIAILATMALKPFILPTVVLSGAEKLSAALLPLIVIAVGMKIDVRHIKENFGRAFAILAVKMGLVPLFILATLPTMGVVSSVILIESAMPPMVMVAVFAARYSLDEKLATSAVALGVFASFITTPLFYYLG